MQRVVCVLGTPPPIIKCTLTLWYFTFFPVPGKYKIEPNKHQGVLEDMNRFFLPQNYWPRSIVQGMNTKFSPFLLCHLFIVHLYPYLFLFYAVCSFSILFFSFVCDLDVLTYICVLFDVSVSFLCESDLLD